MLTIGNVAKAARISVEAIRFYEKRGLLGKVGRTASGYRQYPPETVKRIRFIQHAKDAGFTLAEIDELLRLRHSRRDTCARIRGRAIDKLQEVEQRVRDLKLIRDALSDLVDRCDNNDDMGECPIVEALELEDED
jgi:Hg(II)-responsive transcriptional regulator